jgi:hypothetical protein
MSHNHSQNPYAELFSVAGKTAVITGGSSGLGLAMAEAYLRSGARVYITGRKLEPLEAARQDLAAHGEVHAVQGDVATAEGVQALSLAMAPLANADDDTALSPYDRAVRLLFDHLSSVYGYRTLFQYKKKFAPTWESRFLVFPRPDLLARIGYALVSVHYSSR